MIVRAILIAAGIAAFPLVAQGQEIRPPDVTEIAAATEAAVAPGTMVTVPALTPLFVRIDEELSSKKNRNGDRFRILIAADLRVGGAVVIPAGSVGEGEVIHAARSGAGGKAGELLVAARFVRVGDLEVRLRSLSLGAKGNDRTDESLAVAIVAGPLGLFVVGGVIVIPRGAVASARIAMQIQLPALAPADTPRGEEDDEEEKEGT
jgi:hypothetical protein